MIICEMYKNKILDKKFTWKYIYIYIYINIYIYNTV